MLFNSFAYLVFLPTFFGLYWSLNGRLRAQNALVLLASYLFYGWWDWRFLILLAFSSLVDYGAGIGLAHAEDPRARKALLAMSLVANLGLLGAFKYFNFFGQGFADLLRGLGLRASWVSIHIVLPVGISFYTFQTLSYSIDVYRRRVEPTKDLVAFLAYVSFFPQLVAGPIERAGNLLPQFFAPRRFDEGKAVDGLRQILWGLFKKVVVADSCGAVVDAVFDAPAACSSATLFAAVFLFAVQIYGDFSGYSDVAIGSARLLGFSLMRNFAFPYFSRDVAEFWRRWHISLSTWFRDYVYVPLGGSRGGPWLSLRNILIVFVVSGFWHGANWTFIVWGLLNAVYVAPLVFRGEHRAHLDVVASGRRLPSLREAWQMSATFVLTLVAWVFFRAPSVRAGASYLGHLASGGAGGSVELQASALGLAVSMLAWEWTQREREHALQLHGMPRSARTAVYLALTTLVLAFSDVRREFIYFQF